MNVDSIIVYRSFVSAMRKIKDPEQRCKAYDAMFDYGLDHIETELDDGAGVALEIIKPLLDTQLKNRMARSLNGKKGGRPKLNEAEESEKKLDKAKDTLIGNCELIIDNQKENTQKKRFTAPSLDDVKEYCRQRNSTVDPVKFYEYFTAGNWTDSKGNKVKNWKQKLLTWESLGMGKRRQEEEDHLPVYDTAKNSSMSKEEEKELLALMGKKDEQNTEIQS